jgi:photosystem II stability/assembly factor-like uncharacterized protein
MKNFFLISFLVMSLNVISNAQGWSLLSELPSPFPDINSISVVDPNILWVACIQGYVFRSIDGGITWELKNTGLPSGQDLYGISATDANNCWIGTVNGAIYHTSNGGSNWSQQIAISGSFINGIQMFDINNGVYIGDPTGSGQPYQFRYTTDGGTTWTLSPSAPIAGNEFGVINAWDWTDQNHFWMGSANLAVNATSAKVYYTSTGFTGTFSSVSVAGTGGTAGLYYQAVGFTDNMNGIVSSNGSNIMRTTNGGVSWQATSLPPGVSSFAAININAIKSGTNEIRLSTNETTGNKMFLTTNFGTTWTEEPLPSEAITNGVQHMRFINSNLGFAGCGLGFVLKYTGTVPVELTSFTGNVNNLGQVILNWETATEINNQGFEIERRTEDSDYRTIGFVEGYGSTTEQRSYLYKDMNAENGINYYRLKQVDFNGSYEYSSEVEVDVTSPLTFALEQNYPNPFNPSTNIKYSVPETGNVKLSVYNTVGEEVAVLVNGFSQSGFFEVSFNASSLPSGVYLYKLQSANSVQTKKMMLLK